MRSSPMGLCFGGVVLAALCTVGVGGCASASPPPASVATFARPAPEPPARPLDPAAVGAATGAKPEVTEDVIKVSFPRTDVAVEVDGWTKMPPFMGLTSWAAFAPGRKAPAMVMGDLVLFEDEVSPVMSAALEGGVEVTALHNHFFFDTPRVYFMHIGGEGTVEALGKTVRGMLDAQAAVRSASAQPRRAFASQPAVAGPSTLDAAALDAAFGMKGTAKDGMYKAVMGRKASAACGCTIGKAMGVNTWAAFAGTAERAVVDGDFAVSEGELQPVLRSLRGAGIHVVAIHSHMTGETPRVLFLHYWGRGPALELASAVKRAVDLTAWDRPTAR